MANRAKYMRSLDHYYKAKCEVSRRDATVIYFNICMTNRARLLDHQAYYKTKFQTSVKDVDLPSDI